MVRTAARARIDDDDIEMSDSEPEDVDDEEGEDEEVEQGDDDDEAEQEDMSELGDLSAPSSPPAESSHVPQPRIKITLKLPARAAPDSVSASTPTRIREISRDIDIESEDEDEDDAEQAPSTRSTSVVGRPMTTRQAVLASVVDSSHVSLNETSRKKKQLNEAEIALRREETARKRKNLSEKKLEDEKMETINRLLKKQSRPKNKRNALSTADDRTAPASPAIPAASEAGEEIAGPEFVVNEVVPTMYRWTSSTKTASEGDKHMALSFSVPVNVLRSVSADLTPMEVGMETAKPLCDVQGCNEVRKYRLVKDWARGACGMGHLKVLEGVVAHS